MFALVSNQLLLGLGIPAIIATPFVFYQNTLITIFIRTGKITNTLIPFPLRNRKKENCKYDAINCISAVIPNIKIVPRYIKNGEQKRGRKINNSSYGF
jgi:hypothetical protein